MKKIVSFLIVVSLMVAGFAFGDNVSTRMQGVPLPANGLINPWPNGVVLGKLVWQDRHDEHWPSATVPAKFTHAEFMFKNSVKWKSTGGWGWARWLGEEQKPFGVMPTASDSCFACHTSIKGRDWVYTTPAIMPKRIELQ